MTQADQHYKKMTETPVEKLILSLSIPTIISMLISNIYNLADTYFVGTLGVSASGAVGILFTLMSILQAIGFTLGHGAGSVPISPSRPSASTRTTARPGSSVAPTITSSLPLNRQRSSTL